VKNKKQQILLTRKENLSQSLDGGGLVRSGPVLIAPNLYYDVSGRIQAIACGGLGVIHLLVQRIGLGEELNSRLHLLKRHLPYWESDHILHVAYNVLTGGTCLQDMEALRQDSAYLIAMGAERLPDPTTVGDFLRRFTSEESLLQLQEAINTVRQRVWRQQDALLRQRAIIDVDGTHTATDGECKAGMDISYKGVWGYAPLVIALDNTREVLYLVNRPGNVVSHQGAVPWIDRAINLVKSTFKEVWLRGDTDFSLTEHFDRWDTEGIRFVFGFDASPPLIQRAEGLPDEAWQQLERPPAYEVKTRPRKRPPRIKAERVRQRGYKNIRLETEEVAFFSYQPTQCRKTYRMVVLRKHLAIEKRSVVIEHKIRYFFYITNDQTKSTDQVVEFSNDRADAENTIAQLKHGIQALRCPGRDLYANWAYMVITTLAWNLKAWYGLLMPDMNLGHQVLRMEFKRFFRTWLHLPCQILQTGRKVVYRLLQLTPIALAMLTTVTTIKQIKCLS